MRGLRRIRNIDLEFISPTQHQAKFVATPVSREIGAREKAVTSMVPGRAPAVAEAACQGVLLSVYLIPIHIGLNVSVELMIGRRLLIDVYIYRFDGEKGRGIGRHLADMKLCPSRRPNCDADRKSTRLNSSH